MWHVIWISERFRQVSCITHPSHLRYVDSIIFHLDFQPNLGLFFGPLKKAGEGGSS